MDLNQLYFDHQISLMRIDGARSDADRQDHRRAAAAIAERIRGKLRATGAAALREWEPRLSA
jgi:hypothetical protein